MTERERKMMAFLAGMIMKLSWESPDVSSNEVQQLDNICEELGFYKLDENEFRY